MSTLVVTFTPEHLTRMNVLAGTARSVASSPDVAGTLKKIGAKTILTSKGAVIGIVGAVPLISGVCEVFVLASEDQKNHPIAFATAVRKELKGIKSQYRRVQALTVNDKFHTRWITWLGFSREGLLQKYGLNGEDMVMWGLT